MSVRPDHLDGNDSVKEFLLLKNIAVAGSFRSAEKVAYRVFSKLRGIGHNVIPINPSLSDVEGIKCYPSVLDIPNPVDGIDIVTPPKVTEKIVEQCKKKGIKYVWMQPGAESQKAISFCEENDIIEIHDKCILVEAG